MPRSNHSSNTLSAPPAALVHRMPAEWAPHAATWLAWPHHHGDWPGKFDPIPWVYTEIIRNLARHERVDLIVNNAAMERKARKLLERSNAPLSNVQFHRWPTNRSWLRDSGCIFTTTHVGIAAPEGRLLALNFRFNAWAKYSNYRHDEKIGSLNVPSRPCSRNPPAA